jgi:hypothetical protein
MKINYTSIMCALLLGCTSVGSNKVNVNIEKKETSSLVRFQNVRVTSADSVITVKGSLRATIRSTITGHVDITFLSPEGNVIHALSADIHRLKYKSRDYHFHAEALMVLPDNSTIELVYHRRIHN